MDSIGEFLVVILHSLAHIKSGDMTDDSNTLFLREFYRVSVHLEISSYEKYEYRFRLRMFATKIQRNTD